MTMFSELQQSHADGERKLMDYEARCLKFVHWLQVTLVSMLGWPADRTQRLDLSCPNSARKSPRGYIDAKGYHFVLRFSMANFFVDFCWVVRMHGPKFVVDTGDLQVEGLNDDPAAFDALARYVRDSISEQLQKVAFADLVEGKYPPRPWDAYTIGVGGAWWAPRSQRPPAVAGGCCSVAPRIRRRRRPRGIPRTCVARAFFFVFLDHDSGRFDMSE